MRKPVIILALIVTAGLFIGGLKALSGFNTRAVVGQAAPEIILPDMAGKEHKIADYRGQVTMINIWATWCIPCREEMPALEQFQNEMKGKVKVLAVDRAEPLPMVKEFAQKYKLSFTILMDREDRTIRAYQVTGVPETFFIDGNGVLRNHWVGPMNVDQMRDLVKLTEQGVQYRAEEVR